MVWTGNHEVLDHTEVEAAWPSAISTTDLTKHYPGVPALTDLDPRRAGRLDLRLPRPERRRQDDRHQDPGRSHPADERHAPPSPVSRSRPARPTSERSATSARNPASTTGCPAARRSATSAVVLPVGRATRSTRRVDDAPRAGRARPMRPTGGRGPTPAACASGSASPRPSSAGRGCSCSTSRSARSTRSAGGRPRPAWSGSRARPPSSTPPTSSTTSSGSATTSRSSTTAGSSGPRPTAELLASFTRDRLAVIVRGGHRRRGRVSPRLPGVPPSRRTRRDGDSPVYVLIGRARRDSTSVQRAVTRLRRRNDLTLVTENCPVHLDLEDVFLRLIDSKEHAA